MNESPIQTIYPSIASLRLGRALGVLYESIPLGVGVVKLSYLLFPLPTAPLAAFLYLCLKAGGKTHHLTTARLYTARGRGRNALAEIPLAEIPLAEIARIDIHSSFGQRFFRAGDLSLRDQQGTHRMNIKGIAYPEMFRRTILDAREALLNTQSAQRTINARHLAKASGGMATSAR